MPKLVAGRNQAPIRLRGDLRAWAGIARTRGRFHSGCAGSAHALPGRVAKLGRSLGETADERVSRDVCDWFLAGGRGWMASARSSNAVGRSSPARVGESGGLQVQEGRTRGGGGRGLLRVPRGASPHAPSRHNETLDTLCCIIYLRDSPIRTGWSRPPPSDWVRGPRGRPLGLR